MRSALVAAGAGRKEPSVSATDIAHRGELRGLAGELVCLDMQHQSGRRIRRKYRYSWSNLVADIAFGAGSGWSDVVRPHDQNALLGSLGEQYFDIAICLASKEEWRNWLDISTRIAVSTAASDVLLRLLAAYDDPVGDDTLARLLSAATREGIVEVLPALIAAGAGPKECSMSNADIARRKGLRGLGKELVRLDVRRRGDMAGPMKTRYAWSPVVANVFFFFVADSRLHDVLRPYHDAALLESHGEQLLDFVIRLASKEQWKAWLDISASVAVKVEATSVLRRLFAAYEDSVDDKTLTELFRIHGRSGSVDTLSALIDAGAKVREFDDVRWPGVAFHVTASAGHRTLVAKLIEIGASSNSTHLLLTALTDAVEGGHKGVVLEFLAAGADVNISKRRRCPCGMLTPLGIAVIRNDVGMVKVLLEAGAEPNPGPTDDLLLHIAANKGFLDIANRLLLAGASVTSVDSLGRSALHIACARSHHGFVELLLRHNSNVASLCNSGQTPMDIVGVQALELREWRNYPPWLTWGGPPLDQWYWRTGPQMYRSERLHPSTLNSAETSTVDQIYDMLQAASSWRRRGWVMLMRSRPLAEVVEQLTRSGADGISLSDQGICFVWEPSSNTAGVIGQEGGVVQTLHDGGKARDDWSAAVGWVLQAPDENLFRKIVRFL